MASGSAFATCVVASMHVHTIRQHVLYKIIGDDGPGWFLIVSFSDESLVNK